MHAVVPISVFLCFHSPTESLFVWLDDPRKMQRQLWTYIYGIIQIKMSVIELIDWRGLHYRCLHLSLLTYLRSLYSHRTETDTFNCLFLEDNETLPGTEYLFLHRLKSMSDGDVFLSQMNITPEAGSCISPWTLNTPLRGASTDADWSSLVLIWPQNRSQSELYLLPQDIQQYSTTKYTCNVNTFSQAAPGYFT